MKSFIHTTLISILLLCSLTWSGCNDNTEDYLFEVDHAFTFEIPAGQNTFEAIVISFEQIKSKIAAELFSRSLSADDIKAVHTARARIDLVDLQGDLSVLRAVQTNIWLGPDPTINPYEAGYTIQIPDQRLERIDIIPSLSNLKEVLRNDIFNMELVLNWERVNFTPMQARYTISFGVVE